MKTLAIIQARTSSSRLPGKVMLPILDKPMIIHQLERVSRCHSIDQLVLATSDHPSDDQLAHSVATHGFNVFRGDLRNVLARFQSCASAYDATTVVRLTGDCPLSDPSVIDEVVTAFHTECWEYLSNSADEHNLTVPDGFDVEVFTRSLLDMSASNAVLPSELEHVTPWMRRPESGISSSHYRHVNPTPFYRLTVDDEIDFQLVRQVFEALYPTNPYFDLSSIINFLQRHSDLALSNLSTIRNEGYLRSLDADS